MSWLDKSVSRRVFTCCKQTVTFISHENCSISQCFPPVKVEHHVSSFSLLHQKCKHCTLHTAHYTLHTAQCTLPTANCAPHTKNCILYNTHCPVQTVHCTLRTVWPVHCTVLHFYTLKYMHCTVIHLTPEQLNALNSCTLNLAFLMKRANTEKA